MVPIQQRVSVGKVPFIPGIQENTSGKGKVAVNIRIDVGQVCGALEHRVVDLGVVHRDPGADVRVDGQQLFKGCPAVLFHSGLDFHHISLHVAGSGVDSAVIPQGIGRVDACHAQAQDHNQIHKGVSGL